MQFLYHEESSCPYVSLSGESFLHVVKSRRAKEGDKIALRNLKDGFEYEYEISQILKKEATLQLLSQTKLQSFSSKEIVVGWCIVDAKSVEKTLPMLNELGVKKIVFVKSDFSQGNFKLDYERFNRILINSSQQCGRGDLLEFEELSSVSEWCEKYSESVIVDFCKNYEVGENISTFLVGPEGGFSPKERETLSPNQKVGLRVKNILRSETAVVYLTSKLMG